MTIDIIGGGIGGLTTAIALEQKGVHVRIFEQAEQIKPVGAGIILANNAMQVFEKLGMRNVIEQNGIPISSMNITEANLKPISKIDLAYFEEKHQVKNIAIHRGTLQQILINQLQSSALHLNCQLDSITPNENGHALQFKNGKQIQSSVLLGADGIHSVVRQHLFPNIKIRIAKQVCWRGVTDFQLPVEYEHKLYEAWGKKDRFGFVPIAKNKVYWYTLKSFNNHKDEFPIKNLEAYFDNYHPIINQIISSTNTKEINTAEITDLTPTNNWYKGTIGLLGDAAHATTPNMGQGACQAIEDAYVLAACLNKEDIAASFEEFRKLRLPKAHQVVKASWMVGKISHLSNPILIGLRNQFMRWTPASMNRKQSEYIFQIPNL